MKKNFFVKATAMCLVLASVTVSFGACKKTKKDKKEVSTVAGAWDGKRVYEIDEDAMNGYTYKVAAYRDLSDDPLNHDYADGAEAFMKKYKNTKVEYIVQGDHEPDKIQAAIASGDIWDLQLVFTCSQMPGDIVDGLYESIDGYFDKSDSRIDMNSMKGGYFDGHYYGVSNAMMNEINYFTYNETVFKENGIKTPHEYYAEGKWNFDAFFEICTALNAKGLKINTGVNSEIGMVRPDWILKKATKWNDDFTEVEIILDSADTRQYLDKLRTILYDYQMNSKGSASKREVALYVDVVPNVIVTNEGTETTDSLRYIYFPSTLPEEIGPHVYLTDAQFMTPSGCNPDTKAGAVELGIYMCEAREKALTKFYQEKMNEEDYAIFTEAMGNAKVLPRAFSPDFPYYAFQFHNNIKTGKPIATYVAEFKTVLDGHAATLNKKIVDYREETGLSAEKND